MPVVVDALPLMDGVDAIANQAHREAIDLAHLEVIASGDTWGELELLAQARINGERVFLLNAFIRSGCGWRGGPEA